MVNRATIPIGVMPGTKLVRVEWVQPHTHGIEHIEGHWRLWTHHDITVTDGTFFKLEHNGAMTRVVAHPDGHEDYFTVKEAGP